MAMYEFECESCGEVVEVIQHFEDPPPEHCEHPMKRVISGGHITLEFRGDGFYETDYKAKHKD